MYKFITVLGLLLFVNCVGISQVTEYLSLLPNPVSNNAVTSAQVNGKWYVYSFSGIDSTKTHDGIHKKGYKYDVENDLWTTVDELPSGNGRVAASASTVKNKIYIIGGYEVLASGNEISYNNVHVFNPEIDEFESDGMPVPVPIDDHVHAVYKDSLIYIITGWSNNANVANVQIYNPALDDWQEGTSLPNSGAYKVFGGTGQIIGDSIFYIGGAYYDTNFPLGNKLRKGYINPTDPTDITWSNETNIYSKRYRPGSLVYNEGLLWFGGSTQSYNYNALAYAGGAIVEPANLICEYRDGHTYTYGTPGLSIMDIRSIAKISDYEYIIVGGMITGGEVSNQCVKIDFRDLDAVEEGEIHKMKFNIDYSPNPVVDKIKLNTMSGRMMIYDLNGRLVYSKDINGKEEIDFASFSKGAYFMRLWNNDFVGQNMFIKQ